jgi:hypothetical protein
MTVLYDQATEGTMDPVVVAMSSAFAPFSGSGIAALTGSPARRKVEYGSGIIMTAAGHILGDRRLADGCNVIEIAGYGNAERVAEDPAAELALLRIYGAPDLVPLPFPPANEGAKGPDLILVGIADPQAQRGSNAVSTMAAHLNGDTLLPPPPAGFDGAAAIDPQGHLFGVVVLKDGAVANAAGAASPGLATVVAVPTLRKFLEAQSVTPASGRIGTDSAKAALVRVICVRK